MAACLHGHADEASPLLQEHCLLAMLHKQALLCVGAEGAVGSTLVAHHPKQQLWCENCRKVVSNPCCMARTPACEGNMGSQQSTTTMLILRPLLTYLHGLAEPSIAQQQNGSF
jgi:hypothetical protein